MYNGILKGLYREFKAKRGEGEVHFLNESNKTVAILYPSTQVINIFLGASSDVIWNHWHTAIFVLAKNWTTVRNKHIKNAEATWLIGLCGAPHTKNLVHPMFLDSYNRIPTTRGIRIYNSLKDNEIIEYDKLSRVCCTEKENEVKFKILDYEITYSFEGTGDFGHISYLNPALVYPVKTGGRIDREKQEQGKDYLRQTYRWEFEVGTTCCGSAETRMFIEDIFPETNHMKLSKIRYSRTFAK